jgi:hypothetical protein
VELSTIAVAGIGYQWKNNGTNILGANSNSYITKISGVYTLQATNNLNCSSTSNSITTSTKPTPPVPVLSWDGFKLSTNVTGVTYQWYFNGNLINGATASSYTPNVNGEYKVAVTLNVCSSTSQNYTLLSTSVSTTTAYLSNQVKVYPNPANNELYLKFDKAPVGDIDIQLLNSVGAVVKSIKTRNKQHMLSVHDLPSGSYIIKILGGNVKQISKIEILK